jgi:hypothetical protein
MTVARIGVAVLVVGGAPAIHVIDTSNDTLAGWLFVVGSFIAGVLIARWWASATALVWLVVGATASPGREDTASAAFVLIGVLPAIAQALLIGFGAATAKVTTAWRSRPRAS